MRRARSAQTVPPSREVLDPDRFFERLKPPARKLVGNWPFADVAPPIASEQLIPSHELHHTPAGVIQVTGRIIPGPDTESTAWVQIGSHLNPLNIDLDVGGKARAVSLDKLSGLLLSMSLELAPREPNSASSFFRSGTLLSIIGIQRPLRTGDPEGLAYGEVLSVRRLAMSQETTGVELRIGDTNRAPLSIVWNPSRSAGFRDIGITSEGGEGNIVALSVANTGSNTYRWWLEQGYRYLIEPAES